VGLPPFGWLLSDAVHRGEQANSERVFMQEGLSPGCRDGVGTASFAKLRMRDGTLPSGGAE
jgi:hypothetical protein